MELRVTDEAVRGARIIIDSLVQRLREAEENRDERVRELARWQVQSIQEQRRLREAEERVRVLEPERDKYRDGYLKMRERAEKLNETIRVQVRMAHKRYAQLREAERGVAIRTDHILTLQGQLRELETENERLLKQRDDARAVAEDFEKWLAEALAALGVETVFDIPKEAK